MNAVNQAVCSVNWNGPAAKVFAVEVPSAPGGRKDIAASGAHVAMSGALVFFDAGGAMIHALAPGEWLAVKRVR